MKNQLIHKPSILDRIFSDKIWQSYIVVVLAGLLYLNTAFHDFAVDDGIVIHKNEFVAKGISGIPDILSKDTFRGFFKKEGKDKLVSGGRYRPLTLVVFSIIYEIVGPMAPVYHILQILAYAFLCFLIYKLFCVLLNPHFGDSASVISFLGALLFAAHPIHTEVVANIKGMDEVAALLFSVLSFHAFLKAADTKMPVWNMAGMIWLFLGLMSKENAIGFVLLIPVGLWTLYRQSFSQSIKVFFLLLVPTFLFLIIRAQILGWNPIAGQSGELMNNPFLKFANGKYVFFSAAERYATILFTLFKYLGLLSFPHPLTYDYYPKQIPIQNFSNLVPWISLTLHLAMLWFIFKWKKTRPLWSWSLLCYLVPLSLVSNLVFPIGTFMGERFLFMSSLGFAMILGSLFYQWKIASARIIQWSFILLILLYSLKTISRNMDWKNDFTLILHDAQISSNSAKINNAVGGILLDQVKDLKDSSAIRKNIVKAKTHLLKAIDLHPFYFDAYNLLGNAHFMSKEYDIAAQKYEFVLKYLPEDSEALNNLHLTLRENGRNKGMVENNPQAAILLLNRALQLKPDDPETISLLGVGHGVMGDYTKAIEYFNQVLSMQPESAEAHFNLYLTYMNMGNTQKAEAALAEAQKRDPDITKKFNANR
ncbi:MAG: tetratricopeptide repeat protein [Saprospiraceae bacterium]|nr:tetratricopeptide repeat protein [Saprospiraceae bacterium]